MEELQMKKSTLLLTGLVCSSLLAGGALPVFAADNDTSTTGEVTFTADTDGGGGGAVDPGGDGEDGGKTEPDGGGSTGALRIQHVTNMDFGTQKIQAVDKTYNAKVVKFIPEENEETGVTADPYFMPNFLQVADTSGTHEGWKVKVSATTFNIDPADRSKDILKGAQIRLTEFVEGNATGDGVTTTLPTASAPLTYIPITDTPETIYSAGVGVGTGLHTLIFGETEKIAGADASTTQPGVQLYVPSTSEAKAATYSADLTWTITAAPL